ncbi:hypothetical protein TruAng_006053 [Truncatella angustata]|nr:hypothetical protein TruAng_006053 [Truncatella angustata]
MPRTHASLIARTRRCYSGSANNHAPTNRSHLIWLYCTVAFGSGVAGSVLLLSRQRIAGGPIADHAAELAPETLSDTITRRLSSQARIYTDKSGPVAACHLTKIASNSPCEDYCVRGQLESSEGLLEQPWSAWAVYDGHVGSQTAALLTKVLFPVVGDALSHLPHHSTDETVERTIKEAFVALDDDIVKGAAKAALSNAAPYHERMGKLTPAYAGSCALLSFLDPRTWTLRVACVGDSRAVLGSQDAGGNWTATALSIDQTGSNEVEIARINAEHPGEGDIAKDGRILGIMVSRAFGDGRWKWDAETQEEIKNKYDGFKPLAPEKYAVTTPPYLTAEPVVTTTKLDKERSSFLIMASDGFWDRVSNEQAVNLVSCWLDSRDVNGKLNNQQFGTSVTPQPQHERFQMAKHRQGEPGFLFSRERSTLQDENAAVHLARNALGGNFQEMVAANLLVDSPFSRYVRDDITIQVIFFDPKKRS